uniref:Uncharacterized protein n=1 Tax=Micrurus paraensis TaxID=1970185 RepID=A0A2D4JVD6_9SAUR
MLNPGTGQDHCLTVIQEVSQGAPHTHIDPGVTQEAQAEGGTVVAAQEVEAALTTVAEVIVTLTVEAPPEATLTLTGVGRADPTPMTVTIAGVAAVAEVKGVTVITGLVATTDVPDLTGPTAKVTAAILIAEVPVKAADTAESRRLIIAILHNEVFYEIRSITMKL